MTNFSRIFYSFAFFFVATLQTWAQPITASNLEIDVVHTGIEDLLKMNITSVSKTEDPLWGSAAAVYVLTNDRIRRSGVTSVPEALRLVPGVQVARIDANKWAVTARGFNSRTANKLLVMIDGRSIYDPLFSGTVWEAKDVMLEDVERIEVVRGPGGSVWGENAVNGVINIITKSAKDTLGGLVTAGGGTEERALGAARYGAALGDTSYVRVYGKYNNRDSGFAPRGIADDDSHFGQTGFRLDSEFENKDKLSIQGDYYDGKQGYPNLSQPKVVDQQTSGAHVLLRWDSEFEKSGKLTFLSYYDHSEFDVSFLRELRDTFAGDLQHEYQLSERHRLVGGLHYRYTSDDVRGSEILSLDPRQRADALYTAFIEDRITLLSDELYFTLGSKFEDNDYTGFEFHPTARLAWEINEHNMLWAAISRAARVPSRIEEDLRATIAPGTVFTTSREGDSEILLAYELGYRVIPMEDLAFDISTFYNVYDKLLSVEGLTTGNSRNAESHGVELSSSYSVLSNWRIEGTYTYLRINHSVDAGSLDSWESAESAEDMDPRNQFTLQSMLVFNERWEFDAILRYVDDLSTLDVDSYLVGDLRLAYMLSKSIELSVVGQNLFEGHHYEQSRSSSSAVEQGVYGKIRWNF